MVIDLIDSYRYFSWLGPPRSPCRTISCLFKNDFFTKAARRSGYGDAKSCVLVCPLPLTFSFRNVRERLRPCSSPVNISPSHLALILAALCLTHLQGPRRRTQKIACQPTVCAREYVNVGMSCKCTKRVPITHPLKSRGDVLRLHILRDSSSQAMCPVPQCPLSASSLLCTHLHTEIQGKGVMPCPR